MKENNKMYFLQKILRKGFLKIKRDTFPRCEAYPIFYDDLEFTRSYIIDCSEWLAERTLKSREVKRTTRPLTTSYYDFMSEKLKPLDIVVRVSGVQDDIEYNAFIYDSIYKIYLLDSREENYSAIKSGDFWETFNKEIENCLDMFYEDLSVNYGKNFQKVYADSVLNFDQNLFFGEKVNSLQLHHLPKILCGDNKSITTTLINNPDNLGAITNGVVVVRDGSVLFQACHFKGTKIWRICIGRFSIEDEKVYVNKLFAKKFEKENLKGVLEEIRLELPQEIVQALDETIKHLEERFCKVEMLRKDLI